MRALVAALAGVVAEGCIAPSVVDSSGRAVAVAEERREWVPAEPEHLEGLFESTAIEGEAAASLWRVLYHFTREAGEAQGEFTGAALVLGDEAPQFQTLVGRWRLAGGRLDLGDGAEVEALVSGDSLRLSSAGGVLVLERVALQ